jgi:Predicted membrane protein
VHNFQKGKKKLEQRNLWEPLSYLFFGGLTTVVNLLIYYLCFSFLHWHYLIATSIAWLGAVIFAFMTNKKWVFNSNTISKKAVGMELIKFIFYRVLSLVIDASFMVLLIDVCTFNNWGAKIFTQVIVVLANYLFSKFLIFKKI